MGSVPRALRACGSPAITLLHYALIPNILKKTSQTPSTTTPKYTLPQRFVAVKSPSAGDVQSHSWPVKVLDFAPFRGSYVREFELSQSNLVNRFIKITHAHNLHMKMLNFAPFTIYT